MVTWHGRPSTGKAKAKGATANSVAYHKYSVLESATWKAGEAVPYLFLARVFGKIENESKRYACGHTGGGRRSPPCQPMGP